MAPDPGNCYTVSCALKKAVLDPVHLVAIQNAVERTSTCTRLATDLLNLYVRDRIENHDGEGLDGIFTQNWLIKAYQTVSVPGTKHVAKVDPAIQCVFDTHMKGTFEPPSRSRLRYALNYECRNLRAVGSTNVWMHFQKRVLSYTRTCFALDDVAHAALSKDERRLRKLALMQAAGDVCRAPTVPLRCPEPYHAWVASTRIALGIDTAVGDWSDKSLLYHLKTKPHRFLKAMHVMSQAQHDAGRKAFALFPLRRSHVPRHMRFDQAVLDELLSLGMAYTKTKAKAEAKKTAPPGRAPKRARDDTSLVDEKRDVFSQVLDLKRAGVRRRDHFEFAFTTDGVSLHLNMEKPSKGNSTKAPKGTKPVSRMPTRGIHSIDTLKAVMRSVTDLHVVGIDPGRREPIVAVDVDDPKGAPVVRYTLRQRQRDLRTRQYADESKRTKPPPVTLAEEELSEYNSKAPSLAEYARFSAKRRALLRERVEITSFYADMAFRERRRKGKIKAQKSEARVVKQLKGMHAANDLRQLVLAYGAWGLVAGRPGMACNKGNPPVIGAGFMKRLSRDFLIVPTPEHYTSKTCVKCGGLCGAHPTLKTNKNKEIRGLRVCQHEGCGLLQNRDKTGATNIGLQFQRLVRNQPPLRPMSDEELEFHKLNICVECHD